MVNIVEIEEQDVVSARLKAAGGDWTAMPPNYIDFSREHLLQKLEDVYKTVTSETSADRFEIDSAYGDSQEFINSAFDFYHGERSLDRRIGRAFIVPMRSTRHDEHYASESVPFLPLLDPVRFGVNSDIRMRAIYGLPPTVLDTYTKSPDGRETGALVLAPLYSDMTTDIMPDRHDLTQRQQLLDVGKVVLEKTAHFAHHQLGAGIVGLGATLPKVTHFGQALRSMPGMERLTTTTGHGGTVYMIIETALKILNETATESGGKLGVIGGAGSIGWSSIVAAVEMIEDHRIYAFDINAERLHRLVRANGDSKQVIVAENATDVLRETNIIVTAVTGRIDLTGAEFQGIDLAGKVIIDDSQPGCFDAAQVKAKGGKLVWVVGEDGSDSGFMTRDGCFTAGVPYNYGDESGLHGQRSEFACGQEAAVIAKYEARECAVHGPVTPDDVRTVGTLLRSAGARAAPFQAFGQRVHIR